MFRFEELLEKIREVGPVDREEIAKEAQKLSERVISLSRDLKVAEDWPTKRKIIGEMMSDARRLSELDSLDKAMVLYEMETNSRKMLDWIVTIFKS